MMTPDPNILTAKQQKILKLVADGRLLRVAADEMKCSTKTVEWHLTNIFHKLKLTCRAELALWAVAKGIIKNPFLRDVI